MKKFIIYFLILLSFHSFSQVQIPKTEDSLLLFFKKYPKTDTAYIWGLRRYALLHIYTKPNFKKADSLADELENIAKQLNYPRGYYFSNMIKAINRGDKDMNKDALEYYKKCYELVDEYGLPILLKEASLYNIALTYIGLGNKEKCIEYCLKAIEVQEKNNFKKIDASPYGLIGYVLKSEGKFKEAKVYYDKELKIATANRDDKVICSAESTLGTWYLEQKMYEESIPHFKKVIELSDKLQYLQMKTDALIGLGRVYQQKKQFSASEKYFKEAERVCLETQTNGGLQITYYYMGAMYKAMGKYDLAEKYLKNAYDLRLKNEDLKDNYDAIKALSDFYGEQKQFDKSYKFLLEANQTLDSLNKRESDKTKQELLAKYETEQKETQIKLLNEEAKTANWQRNAFLGGGILAILLAISSIAYLSNRNKLKRFEEEQKLRNHIAADLHDEIGSTLSSISILSEIVSLQQKNGNFKPEIMEQVSNDSRKVIEKMDDIIWTINPENDSIQNLETRLKTFAIPLFESKDIQFNFNFSKEIEKLKIDMGKRRDIYLIMKEAINNLIKYSQCKNASISANISKNQLELIVEDDGIGFDTTAESNRNGLRNMKNRAEKIGGEFKIDSEINKGTIMTLCVNI